MFDTGRTLTHELTNDIGFSIVNGDFYGCEKFLTEEEISIKYRVSRSVVREVIKSLHAKGLLESNSKTGIKLMPPESWSLFDSRVLSWIQQSKYRYEYLIELIDFQKAFEPAAARLAAGNNASCEKVNDIFFALQKIESLNAAGEPLICAEIEFHGAILKAGDNPYFNQMRKIVEASTRLRHRFVNQSMPNEAVNCHYYQMIYSAIKLGDAELASILTLGLISLYSKAANTFKERQLPFDGKKSGGESLLLKSA